MTDQRSAIRTHDSQNERTIRSSGYQADRHEHTFDVVQVPGLEDRHQKARTGIPIDRDTLPFTIEYAIETVSGRVFAISGAPVAVSLDCGDVSGVDLQLIAPPDGSVPQLSGVLMALSNVEDPAEPARIVISLVEDPGTVGEAVAEVTLEGVLRLRPPKSYVLDYDPTMIAVVTKGNASTGVNLRLDSPKG